MIAKTLLAAALAFALLHGGDLLGQRLVTGAVAARQAQLAALACPAPAAPAAAPAIQFASAQ